VTAAARCYSCADGAGVVFQTGDENARRTCKISPGLFLGLFAAYLRHLPLFVRFSCTWAKTGSTQNPLWFKGFADRNLI